MNPEQLRDASLLDLFALEADAQADVLNAGLLALERDPTAAVQLEACMRAAHSLKGRAHRRARRWRARCACDGGLPRRRATWRPSAGAAHIDALLQGTDLLQRIGHPPDGNANWPELGGKAEIDAFVARLEALLDGGADVAALAAPTVLPSAAEPSPPEPPPPVSHGRSPVSEHRCRRATTGVHR
jgi:two-component system sensor histidine kinase and response regulator WspE